MVSGRQKEQRKVTATPPLAGGKEKRLSDESMGHPIFAIELLISY
jgi:hypothetical protein